jgi:hypothetical protein
MRLHEKWWNRLPACSRLHRQDACATILTGLKNSNNPALVILSGAKNLMLCNQTLDPSLRSG